MKTLICLLLFLVHIYNGFGQTQTKKQATNIHKKKITNYPAPPIKVKDTNQQEPNKQGDTNWGRNQLANESAPALRLAQFPGGIDSLHSFIEKHLTYPQIAKEKGIHGTAVICFFVDREGKINHIGVAKSLAPALDTAAIKCIKLMPKWVPASYLGKNFEDEKKLLFNF